MHSEMGHWVPSRDRVWIKPYPGFMVMKKPTRGSSETVEPSVKVNCLRRSRMALSTQCT